VSERERERERTRRGTIYTCEKTLHITAIASNEKDRNFSIGMVFTSNCV
jgi:hypothetical protein